MFATSSVKRFNAQEGNNGPLHHKDRTQLQSSWKIHHNLHRQARMIDLKSPSESTF
jgi:hypothetical protein